MIFEKDVWYVGALDHEVGPAMVGRTIAGVDVVFFREQSGTVSAISDTCPHRFAPFSLGQQIGDRVVCPYHGLQYDGKGRCVHNPHSDLIAPNAHIPAYKVVERHSFIWVWLGDQSLADPDLIPDLSPYETNETQRMVTQLLPSDYRFDILVDNVLDFTHVTYVHKGTFATGDFTKQEITAKTVGETVELQMLRFNSPAPPRDRDLGEFVDEKYMETWYPGQVMPSVKYTVKCGEPFENGRKTVFGNIATPGDDNHTHYFLYAVRFHELDNPEVDEVLRGYQRHVVSTEDGPILETVHRKMKGRELMDMRPLVLPGDSGAMRVRRIMARRLEAEAARANGVAVQEKAA